MRRLSIFALALFLALAGVQRIIGPEFFAPYLARDAALLWLAAAGAATLFAATWQPRRPRRWVSTLPRTGQMLLATGLAVAFLAGLLQGMLAGSPLALTLHLAWWLGLLLILAGAWWPGGQPAYAAPAVHWAQDAGGAFVPVGAAPQTEPVRFTWRREAFWLAVLLVCAALLRFWDLGNLPPGCAGSECINGLRLVEGEPMVGAGNLFAGLAQAGYWLTGASVLSLRLAASLLGLLIVAAVWAAARRLAGPAAALLTALFAVFSPLLLWAGRTSDPWSAAGLLMALALWCVAEALVQRTLRWWTLAGLSLGALFVQAPALRWPALLWLLIALGLAALQNGRESRPGGWAALAAGMLAAAAAALPALFAAPPAAIIDAPLAAQQGENLAVLAAALLRPDSAGLPASAPAGLLSGLGLALAVLGLGALARHARTAVAAALLFGAGIFTWAGARLDGAIFPPAQVALTLLPFVFAAAAVALDEFLAVLVRTWRTVVAPRRLVAAVALVIGLAVVWNANGFMAGLEVVAAGGDQGEGDLARFVAQMLASEPANELTFIVPGSAAAHPSLRLLAGPALAAGRIQPLESARTLPFAAAPPGDLLYLLPMAEGEVLRVLQQAYPGGVTFTELDEGGQRALFNVFRVPRDQVLAAQAATVAVTADGADNLTVFSFSAPALDITWPSRALAASPFAARVTGSLVAPESGVYTFAATQSAGANLLLTLDDMLVLDSSLDMLSQSLPLVQGVYDLTLTYRSETQPGNLRITWQRPGGVMETIGGTALHVPALPRQGLVASYYADAQFTGAPVMQRKELVVGADPAPPLPYSVHWRGKLAAPRTGEYLLGAAGSGLLQASVAGQLLVDNSNLRASATTQAAAGYVESLTYLARGWHAMDVRFAPDAAGGRLRLIWQPAGASPSELASGYLLPATADIATGDLPLPAPPPLADPGLGDDLFALNRASATWQPQQRIPPADLPPLPLEAVWAYGTGCGAGDGQLSLPRGLAFHPATGQLFVADTGNRRVVIVEPDGAPGGLITGDSLQEPVDVAFAPDGAALILDNATQQIYRHDWPGLLTPLPLATSFYRPRGFAVDAEGGYAVADTGGGRLAVLAADGQQVFQFGGQGSLLARGQPVDAVAVNGVYWVVSAEDGRLWNSNIDGSMTAVRPTNTIDGPHLAGLPDGRLLLSDPARSTFWLLTAQGQPAGQFAYAGQLDLPTGIAAREDAAGILIAVSDTRRCSVSLWRLGDQG